MMLGDNGAEAAIFQGVGDIGWQLYGVLTVQDANEEEGYLWYRVVKCVMQWRQAGPGLRGRLEGSCIGWRWCRASGLSSSTCAASTVRVRKGACNSRRWWRYG